MHPSHGRAMVESFFDFVKAGLLEEHTQNYTQDADPEIDGLMTQYHDPAYVINLAQQDFNETLSAFTEDVIGMTTSYRRLCLHIEALSDASKADVDVFENDIIKNHQLNRKKDVLLGDESMFVIGLEGSNSDFVDHYTSFTDREATINISKDSFC